MKKTVLSIGLNDKDTKTQVITTKSAMSLVTGKVVDIGGGTITQGIGIYTHDNGEVVRENTIQVVMYDIDFNTIKGLVGVLKDELNQESIAVEVQDVNSMFL